VRRRDGLNGCGKFRPRGIRSLDRPARSVPLENRMPKLHYWITQQKQQWFPKCFARGPRLASKHDHGSSHPSSRTYTQSGLQISKIKNLYLRTAFRHILMHTRSIRNEALHDLTLTKMILSHFMGTEIVLFRKKNEHLFDKRDDITSDYRKFLNFIF